MRRPFFLLPAAALAAIAAAPLPADPIAFSVTSARLVGAKIATTRTAAGVDVSAAAVNEKDQSVIFDVDSVGGIYRAMIRYRARGGGKGFDLNVGGLGYSGWFPKTTDFVLQDAGLIELPAGKTAVSIGGGWAHFEIAGLELRPAEADAPPAPPKATLANADASPATNELFRRLVASYGQSTLSGVHEFVDVDYVKEKTGHDVAILSRDLIEYTPSRVEHGSKTDGMTEKVIADARTGRVVTLCWHWNAPKDLIDKVEVNADGTKEDKSWYLGFYTKATTFDVAKALADENSEDYKLLIRDIDAIAVELTKLRDANVPVLWRPLHEAEGGWFWWGAKGPVPFVKLWRITYDRLTRHHKLNNLIWVYTSGGEVDWYPGDDVVDIIGTDAYPTDPRDPLTGIWNTLRRNFADRKLLTLSEVGTVPDIDRMRRHGVYWSYFSTWNGKQGPQGMSDDELRKRLASPAIKGRSQP